MLGQGKPHPVALLGLKAKWPLEDILDELAPYPMMAIGAGCRKNWDSALLQDCTMDRHKIIARDYNTVHAPTR